MENCPGGRSFQGNMYPRKKRTMGGVAREEDGSASIQVYSRGKGGLYHTRVGKLLLCILNKAFVPG